MRFTKFSAFTFSKDKLAITRVSWVLSSSVLVVCAAAGCVPFSHNIDSQLIEKLQRDAWYKRPKNGEYVNHIGGNLVNYDRVFEVFSNRESEAEQILDKTCVMELSLENAKRMVGNRFHYRYDYTPYLVRGLYYSKGTGQWEVYELDDKLQVGHFCLGNRKTDTHRQALVILLKSKPANVYTYCGVVAE